MQIFNYFSQEGSVILKIKCAFHGERNEALILCMIAKISVGSRNGSKSGLMRIIYPLSADLCRKSYAIN